MNDISFSIIIPHKNIPALLQRCLDSIPFRDDVQVIVVDDNSDPECVNFDFFPGHDRKDVEVILTKDGEGAGFARNVGLDHAIGKWLIFIDADDFFTEELNLILDEVKGRDEDYCLYNNRAVLCDDISKTSNRDVVFRNLLLAYVNHEVDLTAIRTSFWGIWGKIIKREFVYTHNIRFSETRWANDVFFSCKLGCLASGIFVSQKILYVLTERSGSLTSSFCGSPEEFRVRLTENNKVDELIRMHGLGDGNAQSLDLLNYYLSQFGWKRYMSTWLTSIPFSSPWNSMGHYFFVRLENKLRKILKR